MILGIDPGFTGALCVIEFEPVSALYMCDMPLRPTAILTSRDKARSIDMAKIKEWLLPFSSRVRLAVIEGVHSMPGQGVSSTFKFAESYGQLQGLMAGLDITRVIQPRPAVWKAQLALTANKRDSLAAACKMAPNYSHLFARRKDDGRAEAFLLAMFGARSLGLNFTTLGGDKSNASANLY